MGRRLINTCLLLDGFYLVSEELTTCFAGAKMQVCIFEETNCQQKQAILQNVQPGQGGQVQWQRLAEAFEAQVLELEHGGNPPVDANGMTPAFFHPDITYKVQITKKAGDPLSYPCPYSAYTSPSRFSSELFTELSIPSASQWNAF